MCFHQSICTLLQKRREAFVMWWKSLCYTTEHQNILDQIQGHTRFQAFATHLPRVKASDRTLHTTACLITSYIMYFAFRSSLLVTRWCSKMVEAHGNTSSTSTSSHWQVPYEWQSSVPHEHGHVFRKGTCGWEIAL